MKPLEFVKSWLFSSPPRSSKTSHPRIYRLDIDGIARELDLENEARKLAEASLPSSQQTVITAAEAKAVQRIEKARQDFVEWATLRLGIINDGFARRDVTAVVNRCLQAHKAFERKAGSRLAENEALLNDLAANALLRQRELDDFRRRNGLTRPAIYPEGGATFARYAILLALIVCEGAANAYFFSQGLDSGLIGGFIGAALFAGLNLVVAFVLGKFAVPSVFHRNALIRGFGMLAVALAITCMIGIGLTISQFRDALLAGALEPSKAAWTALQSTPLALHDVNSWLLFCVSLLFAVFALFDGVSSDDRYPGYGRIDRRARLSRDEYLDELQEVREQLEELKDEEQAALDDDIRKVRGVIAELESLIADKVSTKSRLGTALLDAENCLDALMKVFRDANEIHRRGLARPPYFDSRPNLQHIVLPNFSTDTNKAALRDQELLVERLLGEVETLRASIQAAFTRQIDALKPADAFSGLAFAHHEEK